jgi:hypothetical protein
LLIALATTLPDPEERTLSVWLFDIGKVLRSE